MACHEKAEALLGRGGSVQHSDDATFEHHGDPV